MTKKEKRKSIKKKKAIVITGCMLLLLLISAIITVTVINYQNKELAKSKSNIFYYSEGKDQDKGKEDEGDNNLLVVGLNDKNENNRNETNEEKNSNENPNSTNKTTDIPYYIKINNQANVVTIYKKDSNGEYTKPFKAMICSIGTATPKSGVYKMSDKYTWRLLQGNVYGQYAYRITGHILFHSVPYEKQDKGTLEWWEYDKLGTKASLGCIRLKVEDAKWIYDNCVAGTEVEFYSSSNPGPLGKPSAQKISDDEEVRNWDPTDPDKNNPWRSYSKDKKTENKNQQTNTKPSKNNTIKDTNSSNKNNVVDKGKVDNNIKTNTITNKN